MVKKMNEYVADFGIYGKGTMRLGTYPNGRIAIEFIADDGIPIFTLTVNLVNDPIAPDEFFVKGWSENEKLIIPALATGWFVDTGRRVQTGYVEAKVWRFHREHRHLLKEVA